MNRAGLWVFLLIAFGGSWLLALPLWVGADGLASPWMALIGVLIMFTPTAALVAVWSTRRKEGVWARELARQTGLGLGARKGRTLAVTVALWIGVPLFAIVATALSAALGLMDLDLENFSLLRESTEESGVEVPMPLQVLVAVQLVAILPGALFNSLFAFGEEWAWRGWLLPRLMGRGTLFAVVVSGVIWGLWHAPLTLLGYNYAALGPWASLMFVPFCVLFGAVLGWARLSTASVWPAVVGHGALNASAGIPMLVADAAAAPNLALAGPLGVVGMVLLAVVALVLFGLFAPRGQQSVVEPEPDRAVGSGA